MNQNRELIICIPGPWITREELLRALVKAHEGRYLMTGRILLDSTDKDPLSIDWEPHDPRMADAFRPCAHSDEILAEVAGHGSVVYLHFPLNVREQRERILKYTAVFRKAGGIAIKLENSGLSHPWPRWFEWLSAPFENQHYLALVIQAIDEDGGYSCGMHQFGKPDAVISPGGQEGFQTLQAFNQYVLMESPVLKSGQTFSKDADSRRYRLHWMEDDRFRSDELFHNPHGIWQLAAS